MGTDIYVLLSGGPGHAVWPIVANAHFLGAGSLSSDDAFTKMLVCVETSSLRPPASIIASHSITLALPPISNLLLGKFLPPASTLPESPRSKLLTPPSVITHHLVH